MNPTILLRALLLSCLGAALTPALAHAEPGSLALDYHAAARGCPSADRFGDEVSAKLGFVPWDASAQDRIRVRITRDGEEIVGTIEQPDGSSKVLRARSCAKLDEVLVSAVAVALDRGTSPPVAEPAAPPAERRLRTLDRDPDDGTVTVNLRANDGRTLEVSRVTSTMAWRGYAGGYASSAAAVAYEKVCTLPCTARLPRGTNTLIVRDVATGANVTQDATIDVNSTLDLQYVSRERARHTLARRAGWGLLIGTIVGSVAFGYLMEANTSNMPLALHILDPLIGFSTTGLIGGFIGYELGPSVHYDEARITMHPGLATAWKF